MKPDAGDEAAGQASPRRFHLWVCQNPACQLRFPQEMHAHPVQNCPGCGGEIALVSTYAPASVRSQPAPGEGPRVELLVDNLRSALNVGSILRTADGAGVLHVHLCGITPTPQHPKVAKTALGAQRSVPWTHHRNGLLAAQQLHTRGVTLIGLEGGARARSLFELLPPRPDAPLALVVGSEITGVDPAILALCEQVVFLPMVGVKESLNVAVALGIALYHLRFGMRATISAGDGVSRQDAKAQRMDSAASPA